MVSEEDNGPNGIEKEMNEEELHGKVSLLVVGAFSPDAPCGDSHKGVQDCPDWTKDPVWWTERGLVQGVVPLWNGIDREEGSENSGYFTYRYKANNLEYLFECHW